MDADPFGTADLRRRVLDGWAASAARFREDANAEQDLALGGYRDRAVVELAQNAADAAQRAGVPGRLLLRLSGGVLTAANTGAPLTGEGVESMSTLRASAKRGPDGSGEPVGRFGVGFAAVAALADEVAAATSGGAVRWSREAARAAVAARGTAGLDAELERRGGDVPLLRLPFPADAGPAGEGSGEGGLFPAAVPGGYDTAVVLRLRDGAAVAAVEHLLAATGPALLLALPALAEVRIEAGGTERVLTRAEPEADGTTDSDDVLLGEESGGRRRLTRWHTLTRSGRFDPADLADRPSEERGRLDWTLTWAVALGADGRPGLPDGVPAVLHAPTPSDTGLDLPALLIAGFPLSVDRRHVADGPATDRLLAEAADAYAELLTRLGPAPALDLVPGASLGGSAFDARFRAAAAEPIRDAPFLAAADGAPLRPRDAVLAEGGAPIAQVLAGTVPGLLDGAVDAAHPALAVLRIPRIGPAELADLLAELDRPPRWWAQVYRALRAAALDIGELGALPVPLADGRTVRGPRSLLILDTDAPPAPPQALAPLGLRVVHPDATDPILLRLGAVEADAAAVLADPNTRAAVEGSIDADHPDAVAGPVLRLAAAAGASTESAPYLAELALRDTEGDYAVAAELLLPDSPLREVLADDAPLGVIAGDLVDAYGRDVLAAVGVLDGFAVLRAGETALTGDLADAFDAGGAGVDVDGIDEWAEESADRAGDGELPPTAAELTALADLDYVRSDRWDRALELIAADPAARAAVVEPARLVLDDGTGIDVPSYSAWWLRTGALLGGQAPATLRTAGADPVLQGLFEAAPEGLDPVLARAIGVRSSLADVLADPDGADDLLDRLADPECHLDHRSLHAVWTALADAAGTTADADPPERVRALQGGTIVVADAGDAVVVDAPDLLPLVRDRPVLLPPAGRAAALADVLDVALASEEVEGAVRGAGEIRAVPETVRYFIDTGVLTYLHHDRLVVDGTEVEWRADGAVLHAATPAGLARALCWEAGEWPRRHLVAAVLDNPDDAALLLAEADLEDTSLDTAR
ncbi:sacsin N-terminal ATP-binding-like domain-containing protein [Nocardiopsis coralliicola]